MFKDTVLENTSTVDRSWSHRLRSLPATLADLRAAVRENRRLNGRLVELTETVAELLVPLVEGEPEKARALLEEQRRTTPGT